MITKYINFLYWFLKTYIKTINLKTGLLAANLKRKCRIRMFPHVVPAILFFVESTLAKRILGLLAISYATLSYWGADCSQWLHQGAENITKTSLSFFKTNCLKFLPTIT